MGSVPGFFVSFGFPGPAKSDSNDMTTTTAPKAATTAPGDGDNSSKRGDDDGAELAATDHAVDDGIAHRDPPLHPHANLRKVAGWRTKTTSTTARQEGTMGLEPPAPPVTADAQGCRPAGWPDRSRMRPAASGCHPPGVTCQPA
jgi:hypothetical protein